MLARAATRLGLPLACALLVTLLAGCGGSSGGTTTPAQPAAAHEQVGETGQHLSSSAARAQRLAEAHERVETEQERLHGEQVSKEAERLTATQQEPTEKPETATQQREHEIGLGL